MRFPGSDLKPEYIDLCQLTRHRSHASRLFIFQKEEALVNLLEDKGTKLVFVSTCYMLGPLTSIARVNSMPNPVQIDLMVSYLR